ncbi:Rab3 GTPase-activating protein catalytic subunit isoform 6 [Hibiscus syriacus]|uniref:Rab3 GTPase-activating protein catalytic subunit isoform 6 n=1 Tax=Hibiscus syriacus TaxID=106335 RepID=A0A6A3BK01_HIBSY|nr:Rab3 GTPase-activating protein catalytic subunit isoform 6 [Hibiscus syriacus]
MVKHSKWMPANLGTKQEWQERFKNIRLGKKGVEDSEKVENSTTSVAFYDENLYFLKVKNDAESKALEAIPSVDILNTMDTNNFPPTSVIKQLALAVDNFKYMKDLLASSGYSLPVKERTGLTFPVVKSLVLRDKEDKLAFGFGNLWRELWDTTKSIPAIKQAPLFDEDLNRLNIAKTIRNFTIDPDLRLTGDEYRSEPVPQVIQHEKEVDDEVVQDSIPPNSDNFDKIANEYYDNCAPTSLQGTNAHQNAHWSGPEPEWICLNVDAAVSSTNGFGLQLSRDQGYEFVQIHFDCAEAVKLVNDLNASSSPLSLVRSITPLQHGGWVTDIVWIPRSCNILDDSLPKCVGPNSLETLHLYSPHLQFGIY